MNSAQPSRTRFSDGIAFVLLALMFALAGGAARHESVTIDEVAHIGAGVSALQKFDLRMNEEHPPLAKVIAALPLVMRGVHADYGQTSWPFSLPIFQQYMGEWVFGHWVLAGWNDPAKVLFWTRLPMLLLTLGLGWLLYLYGCRFGGPWGGLLTLCAFATMPAFLAFGPLVLTDIPITFFSLLTMWLFADLWQAPTSKNVWRLGLGLGAALLTKFSSGLLFFFFVAYILALRWRPFPEQPIDKAELKAWRRLRWRQLFKAAGIAALSVYLAYLALSWNEPSTTMDVLHFPASAVFRRLLMPPWLYLKGLLLFALTASRPTFILGRTYPHGVWFYYPILFFLKSPLAFILLLLMAAAGAVLVKRRLVQPTTIPETLRFHWRAVWLFLIVFTAACMLGRLAISIRHFTIPLALMALMLSPLPNMLHALRRSRWAGARAGAWATAILCVACVVTAIRAYPHYIPFFSSLSFGRPIYTLANDSNLDWNQSLPELQALIEKRGLGQILLDEYGFSDPNVYVPQAKFWNCQEASAADGGHWAVVSAGLMLDGHNCPWLLQYPHETLAAGSMYLFRLPEVIPPAGTAGGPPLPSDYHLFAGAPLPGDWRLIFLTCIHDPNQLQPTMDRMRKMMEEQQKQRKGSK